MPKNQFIDFKAVKMAVTMEQALQHYGLLDGFKRSGDSLSGPCPIHKGSNATQFRVSLSKNIWNCFSACKNGGNALDFIAKMEDVSIHAAALKAIEWFGLDASELAGDRKAETDKRDEGPKKDTPSRSKPASKPASQDTTGLNKPLNFRLDKLDPTHPYLAERGLTAETIETFGIGYCFKGSMTERIAIPINNLEGKVVAYAGRWPGVPPDEDTPKYKLPLGFRKSLEIFNIDRALREPPEDPLVIVEGFFDVMKLHQNGCRKVVALMGSTMSQAQEEMIRKHLDPKSHVIVMLREDESGQFGREDIAVHLSKYAYVRVHVFEEKNRQLEHLSAEEVAKVITGEGQ